MSQPSGDSPVFTVSCPCGAQTVVDRRSLDRVHLCPSCKAPLQLPPPPTPPPPPPGSAAFQLRCACGSQLTVPREVIGKEAVCGSCKRVMKLEVVRDPQTLKGVLRVTVIGEMWKLPKPTAQEKWSLEDFE